MTATPRQGELIGSFGQRPRWLILLPQRWCRPGAALFADRQLHQPTLDRAHQAYDDVAGNPDTPGDLAIRQALGEERSDPGVALGDPRTVSGPPQVRLPVLSPRRSEYLGIGIGRDRQLHQPGAYRTHQTPDGTVAHPDALADLAVRQPFGEERNDPGIALGDLGTIGGDPKVCPSALASRQRERRRGIGISRSRHWTDRRRNAVR